MLPHLILKSKNCEKEFLPRALKLIVNRFYITKSQTVKLDKFNGVRIIIFRLCTNIQPIGWPNFS